MLIKKFFIFWVIIFISELTTGQSFIPDTSVNGINLNDYVSTENVIGVKAWESVFEGNNLFPTIEIVNRNKTQVLRLLFHYGGSKNSVDEFEIVNIDKSYALSKQAVKMSVDSFITSRNITLLLKKSSVIKILGDKYKVLSEKGDCEQLYYEIDKPSSFLKRYNQYKYYIKCTFKKGCLTKYSFGFEYP